LGVMRESRDAMAGSVSPWPFFVFFPCVADFTGSIDGSFEGLSEGCGDVFTGVVPLTEAVLSHRCGPEPTIWAKN